MANSSGPTPVAELGVLLPHNALVQLQAQDNHCGEAASEKCFSAATFVSQSLRDTVTVLAREAALQIL